MSARVDVTIRRVNIRVRLERALRGIIGLEHADLLHSIRGGVFSPELTLKNVRQTGSCRHHEICKRSGGRRR